MVIYLYLHLLSHKIKKWLMLRRKSIGLDQSLPDLINQNNVEFKFNADN